MTTPARIVKSLRPQCRHCHRYLNLKEVLDEMFLRLATELAAGERVELPGIGILRPKKVRGRTIRTVPDMKLRQVAGWTEINFRVCAELKQQMNSDRPASVLVEEKTDVERSTSESKPDKLEQRRQRRRTRPGKHSG